MPRQVRLIWFLCLAASYYCVALELGSKTNTQLQKALALPKAHEKLRYRCRVAYDGTRFCGYQVQSMKDTGQVPSIQGELEEVLSKRFSQQVRAVGASRTDAGVHARGQAIHFDLPFEDVELSEEWVQRLQHSMNRMLPRDINIWNLQQAPAPQVELVNDQKTTHGWNAIRKASSKLYSYRICLQDCMDPLERRTRWQVEGGFEVDTECLGKILKYYEGTHDFVCFAGAVESYAKKNGRRTSTVRRIQEIDLVLEDPKRKHYRIDVYVEAALYKMIRNLIGTAIDAARGIITEQQLLDLIDPTALTRKDNESKPAPAQGLILEKVFYDDDPLF